MKKVLNFFCNTNKGQKIILITSIAIIASLVISLMLWAPFLWMGKQYPKWMDNAALYFFIPFITYCAIMLVLFMPYMWYIGTSKKYDGDSRVFLKGMSMFCSIFPGAFIYSYIAKAMQIPSGTHNLAGIFAVGVLYLLIVKTILRKPFSIAQTFMPLN